MAADNDLDLALTDVRRAYRLTWSYQRRIFDMIQLIAAKFPQHQFHTWEALDREPPVKRGTNPLRKWAWDLLPMYRISFFFLPLGADESRPKLGEWMLEVKIITDTGWDAYSDRGEPDAARFEDVTTSASLLTLYAWHCTADSHIKYMDLWRKHEWPEEDKMPTQHPDVNFQVVQQTFNLSFLPDEASVEEAVRDFKLTMLESLNISVDAQSNS